LEPRAPHPEKRLAAMAALAEAGIPTHLSASPVIPAINDHELEAIIERAAEAGVQAARYIPVRLPFEVAPLFQAWLVEHFPDRAAKVMGQIREMRGGKSNDPQFHSRMRGRGVWAQLLATRFARICRKHGLNQTKMMLRTDLFTPPEASGQMRLL
jgi:DNA repair photolyase